MVYEYFYKMNIKYSCIYQEKKKEFKILLSRYSQFIF